MAGLGAAMLAAIWLAARAAITICVLHIEAGRVRVVRGGIAPRVLVDLGDVANTAPRIANATIRITRRDGAAHLEMRGTLNAAQEQRIRNVIGSVPLAKLMNARRKR